MIDPSDPDYLETKKIVLGTESIKAVYVPLITWIEETFSRTPINIYVDHIRPDNRQRLSLIFRTAPEADAFSEKDGPNFDSEKQIQIATKFIESAFWFQRFRARDKTNPLVIFTSFDRVARCDVLGSVSEDILNAAVSPILPNLWCVKKTLSYPIIFLNTKKDVEGLTEDAKRTVNAAVAKLVERHDFCGCFSEGISVDFDSKENFEDKYHGNWFYHSRDH